MKIITFTVSFSNSCLCVDSVKKIKKIYTEGNKCMAETQGQQVPGCSLLGKTAFYKERCWAIN